MVNPKLKDLLLNIEANIRSEKQLEIVVGQPVLDSRNIKSGDTFVALNGFNLDGRKFIPNAIENGASLVIAEANNNAKWQEAFEQNSSIDEKKIIWIEDLQSKVSELAANYYQNPSQNLKVIGVTGTNGKTSCSYLVAKALQQLHFECYLLGTLGVGECNNLQTSDNTTADPITTQKVLAKALAVGAQFASMEISSHGIHQGRTKAVNLHTAIFTNLTRDHLDYHGTMDNYYAAKRQLFVQPNVKNAVINMDDRYGRKLAKDDAITASKWLITTKLPTPGSNLDRWIWAEDVVYSMRGIHAKVYTPWGSGELESPLIGEFNLSNLLVVVACLGQVFKDINLTLKAIKRVSGAPGRMETLSTDNSPLAIVDYAHTPDALKQTLLTIREHNVGNIWCVFGCGGDRDPGKRSLMAGIAEKLANKIVVTNDNPRTENELKIKDDIFSGFKHAEKAIFIANRSEAISYAINHARAGDAVLIAGKGHEDYQIIGTQKYHHSDIEVAKNVLEALNND